MNIKTICLAILFDGDATGYEIRKKSTEGEFSYFVEASYGSIYPALAKLEQDLLVTSNVQAQDGRPAKKVYSITETGRSYFLDAMHNDPGEDVFRSPFLLFARYAAHMPAELVEQRVLEKVAALESHIKELESLHQTHTAAGDRWIIDLGLACQKVASTYMRDHMHQLTDLAIKDTTRDAAE